MAYTQAQIDALRKAIASGILSVTFENRTIQYQSLGAMRALLKDMEAEVSGSSRPRRTVAAYQSDL